MIRHYFLSVVRNFNRYRSSFVINLIGLSSGMACSLLIALWLRDEMAMDKFHENDSRLYQVMSNLETPEGILTLEATPGLLAKALAEEIPEVRSAVSVVPPSSFESKGVVSTLEARVKASGQVVSEDYFKLFSFPLIHGDRDNPFSTQTDVLISDELAKKLFSTTANAIGKTVEWDHDVLGGVYNVAGVFKQPGSHSTAQFDLLFNYELHFAKSSRSKLWGESDPNTYVLLTEQAKVETFQAKLRSFLKSKKEDTRTILFARKYSDKYLHGIFENGVPAGGRILYVRLFSIIALFILTIACINFMNLSTARASRRIKEVGIKKTVGATRVMLIWQYLGESVMMAFLSLFIGLILVLLFIPQFNQLTGKELTMDLSGDLVLLILSITIFTGVVAGSYPALYLSGFSPATVLKGKLNASVGELWIRRGLVVFQFALSVVLIVAVLVVYKQIDYVQSRSLGLDKDNIIYFKKEGKIGPGYEPFLLEVTSLSNVVNASYMWGDFTGGAYGTDGVQWEGMNDKIAFKFQQVGSDLIETFKMEVVAGRSFTRDLNTEATKVIFNEAAIENMGLNDPIGKKVKIWGAEREIIGVVKDFHFESLYEKVKPFFFVYEPFPDRILVRIKSGTQKESIGQIADLYKKHFNGLAFDYKFLDDDYKTMYALERRVANLSWYFAAIAILISCLGLFGLAAFTAERRTKEITIRKVLGSSEMDIILMLSRDFTVMVLASIIIATPISYYLVKTWLDTFEYKITLGPAFFLFSAVLTLLIAWLAVGLQIIKASKLRTVDALKLTE